MKNDNLKLEITIVDNTYDNTVVNQGKVLWKELCEDLGKHLIVLKKEYAPMLIPGGFVSVNESYEFARYGPKSKKPGAIKYRDDGKPHIGRCANNLKTVSMLALDMDGEMTIDEAKERFNDLEYFAYTSFGHRTEKKGFRDAFRILMPFSHPVSAEDYGRKGKAIRKWVGTEMDQSSVDVARGFYIPSYLKENSGNGHRSWRNEGELLDPDIFELEDSPVINDKPIIKTGIRSLEAKGKILWDTLDIVSLFKEVGLYQHHGGGNRHLVTCPWVHHHTGGDKTGTAVFDATGTRKAGFNCKHNSCVDKTAFDVTQWYRDLYGQNALNNFYEVIPTKNERKRMLAEVEEEIKKLKSQKEQQQRGSENGNRAGSQ